MLTAKDVILKAQLKIGTPYFYGAKMETITPYKYKLLKRLYPSQISDTDYNLINTVCCDCSGFINYVLGDKNIKSANMWKAGAKAVFDISYLKYAPPCVAVWRNGHIGLYIGNNKIIECRGGKGVIITNPRNRDFTHWFLLPNVNYTGDNIKCNPDEYLKILNNIYKYVTENIDLTN